MHPNKYQFSSVQFSCSVMSDSLWPHEWQHARPPCPSPAPGSIESVMPSSYLILCCPLLLLAPIPPSIRVFSNESALCIKWPKTGASASASVLPMNIQGRFPLRLTGLISLQSKGISRVLSSTTVWKHKILQCSAFFMVPLSHPYMTTGKTIALTRWTFVGKLISLLFNAASRFAIDFLSKSKHLLISWLQWFWSPRK